MTQKEAKMQQYKMLTIPVTPEFYARFRLKAAENNQTIAAYGRLWLERAMKEPSTCPELAGYIPGTRSAVEK